MRKIALAIVALVSLWSTVSFAQMPGDSPFDPGCNIHQGGNCGKQLDMQNHTWRRLGYPQEPGRGAYGTYLPGGGFIPNQGAFIQPGVVGGVMPGYGGYGGMWRRMGRIVTVTWHRHYETTARSAVPAPMQMPMPVAFQPPAQQQEARVPVDKAPSWLHIQRQ